MSHLCRSIYISNLLSWASVVYTLECELSLCRFEQNSRESWALHYCLFLMGSWIGRRFHKTYFQFKEEFWGFSVSSGYRWWTPLFPMRLSMLQIFLYTSLCVSMTIPLTLSLCFCSDIHNWQQDLIYRWCISKQYLVNFLFCKWTLAVETRQLMLPFFFPRFFSM